MRHCRIAIFFTLAVLPVLANAASPKFPYKAAVTSDEVYVRSGPGQDYYPTDKLKQGDVVEIYRHDPGGWYAIRPTRGSFSWVSSRMLEPGKDGLATVTTDRVAARVGSRFSDIRDVIQVRLDRGEVVELLSGGRSNAAEPAEPWCKIAPPSGEFRWVYGKYVDSQYAEGVRRTDGAPSPLTHPALARDDERRTTHRGPSRSPSESDDAADERASMPALRHLSPEEYQKAIDDLDLKLSLMVAEDSSTWHFAGLARRAEALHAQAQTAVERGQASSLLNRMARFSEIRRGNEELAVARRTTDSTTAGSIVAVSPKPTSDTAGRFDGVGRLARVRSATTGGPTYALLNDQEGVTCYLSPAPGINLSPYEGKRIGVNGVAGAMRDPQAKHVAVKSVALLDDRRLR
jgi:uncharacterized protein YraI